MTFNESENKIIAEIAKEEGIAIEIVEKTLHLHFKIIEHIFQRGMNLEIEGIKLNVIKSARGVLRKQRIGDQKAVIDCIRFDKKVGSTRQQTFQKVNKLKNE